MSMSIGNKKELKKFREGLEIVFKYGKRYRKGIITITILSVISAIFSGSIPYILGSFFDSLINISSGTDDVIFGYPTWLVLLTLFAIFQIIKNIIDYFSGRNGAWLFEFIFNDYQTMASNSLIEKNFAFHKAKRSGENLEAVYRARSALTNILGRQFPRIIPMLFSGVVGVIFCLYINPLLAGIIILGALVYIAIVWQKLPEISRYQKKEEKVYRKSFGDMWQSVANIFEIKKNTTEQIEIKKNQKNFLQKCLDVSKIMRKLWEQNALIQNLVVTITRVAVFVTSVFLITKGTITIGELTAINGYAGMVFGPFINVSNSWLSVFTGVITISKAEEMINTPAEKYEPKGAVGIDSLDGAVEFQNVYFKYGNKDSNVLRGVDFKVSSGEIVALVGESGVGKSTTIDLIGGFYFPQRGKVLVDGKDTKKLKLHDLRRNIAYVSQEVTLFNDTIEKNIKYGSPKATRQEVLEASKKAHCHEFIDKFPKKYKQLVGERGVKLSVGQKQRVSIARAILRDPRILILDEPTSALDSKSERIILKSLEELMVGRTTFIIAHRLSTVRKADKILVFGDGKIIEEGRHEDLMKIKDGKYKKMYEMHVGLQ